MLKIFKYLKLLPKKLKKQMKRLRSSEMGEDNFVAYQHQDPVVTLSSYGLHRSIRTLTYESFIQIITGDDLKPLIIHGNPPIDELVSAWDNISEEYSNAIKTFKAKSVFEAYKKYARIQSKMKMVDMALWYLEQEYDEELAIILHENGYKKILPLEDREAYLKQLKFVKTQAGTLVVMYNQAYAAYKLLAPDDGMKVEKEKDYQGFLDDLAVLSENQGYALRPREITVAEYCAAVNNLMAKVEAQKKKHNG